MSRFVRFGACGDSHKAQQDPCAGLLYTGVRSISKSNAFWIPYGPKEVSKRKPKLKPDLHAFSTTNTPMAIGTIIRW